MSTAAPGRDLAFSSSNAEASEVFSWARRQALASVSDADPVGPWYEAALPGRQAFCMRDVSHQAMGAHALGLALHTRSMLHRFARSATDARDWCCLWEIDRNGAPPAVDYLDDDQFWFCLPANFDVLDCCWRMYTWSGDASYLTDPVFRSFYRSTVYEHVERWDLSVQRIMSRPRLLNVRPELGPALRLTASRGIPGYDEGNHEFTVGFDLLAAMAAGYRAYARIQEASGHAREAALFQRRAAEVLGLIEETWWDPRESRYFSSTDAQGRPVHGGARGDAPALYWRVAGNPARAAALVARIAAGAPRQPTDAVEEQSHLPEVLYRAGAAAAAFQQVLLLAGSDRREYPEVSFSIVGAMTTGLMGIEGERESREGAREKGTHVDWVITTLPRLPDESGWASLAHLPVQGNIVGVRHDGGRATTLTNESGPALLWRPRFSGSQIPAGRTADVIVGAGESITVEAR